MTPTVYKMDLLHCYDSYTSDSDESSPSILNQKSRKSATRVDDTQTQITNAASEKDGAATVDKDSALSENHNNIRRRGRVTTVTVGSFEHGSPLDDVGLSTLLTTRSQPHVSGNWAGHCYCRVRLIPNEQKIAKQCLQSMCRKLEEGGYTGHCILNNTEDDDDCWHVSLSRPFYLQAANIDSFVRSLALRMQTVQPFEFQFNRLVEVLHNDDQTRSFAVWPVAVATTSLLQLVQHCNAVLSTYQQPPYYNPPLFHVSLASFVPALPVVNDNMTDASPRTDPILDSFARDGCSPDDDDDDDDDDDSSKNESDDEQTTITTVHCKFGTTKIFEIPLRQQR